MLEHMFVTLGRSSIEPTLIFSIVVMMIWENWRPFRLVAQSSVGHTTVNLLLTALNHGMVLVLTPWLYLGCSAILGSGWKGLLPIWGPGFAWAFVLTLLATELTTYWVHRMFHAVPALWRVHSVHHCDTAVDVTTAHRHHPLEVLMGSTATLLVLLVMGPDVGVVIAYSLFHIVMTAFSHSNIALPGRLVCILSPVLVTPDFHRLHHASDPRFTNSNYGAVLTCFDWIFASGRHRSIDEARELEYGLEYLRADGDSRLDRLLTQPFRSVFPPVR